MARLLTTRTSGETPLWMREADELNAVRAKKTIKPYKDGYYIDGYWGYVATLQEAKDVVKMLKRVEKNNPDGCNYLPTNRRKPNVED